MPDVFQTETATAPQFLSVELNLLFSFYLCVLMWEYWIIVEEERYLSLNNEVNHALIGLIVNR
jgi:hypothetical protein